MMFMDLLRLRYMILQGLPARHRPVTIARVWRVPKGAIRKWSHSPGAPLFLLPDPAPLILNQKKHGRKW